MSTELAKFIPWLPALGAALCGLCCTRKGLRVWAAPLCILSLFGAFVLSVLAYRGYSEPAIVALFQWIEVETLHGGVFRGNFSYFLDPLTFLMLFVVTGIGTLVAIYAAGYMKGDPGYARFFAGVSLFIFAMTTLVLADNLVLLYLGWEGVGLCSYLLIGYYYKKPTAVAAAKKAFIVNRIGDLGFALGIMLCFVVFGSVEISAIIPAAQGLAGEDISFLHQVIPFLLMIGAFGKSAQIPLYVWLPDAMEGPTPVSALIHAATMVTAGVYMIARLIPIFELSPAALPTVAFIGGLTALFAGTIALCQYDIKRIYAYSTVSQLGYMFLGVGVLSTIGGMFHLFTHAFFKALLFLTAGSVMHALAGQLDLRRMSGLRRKMPITCGLMLVGCLALAGVPGLAGFFSKDMILAAVMGRGLDEQDPQRWLFLVLGVMGLFTAFLTAFYTFRLWFRVFMGPEQYEMGHEHHGVEEDTEHPATAAHPHDAEQQAAREPHRAPAHAAAPGSAYKVEHHHEPHEMPWLMNAPLVILAAGAIAAGWPWFGHWIEDSIGASTAAVGDVHAGHGHGDGHGSDKLHLAMMVISGIIAVAGIALAAYFHWFNRRAADRAAANFPGVVRTLANKYYVDEFYDLVFVRPLYALGQVFFIIDSLIIDGLVLAVGWLPRLLGLSVQPAQRGVLQGYGLGMITGVAVLALLVILLL